jgi:hypothetical protein
MNIAIIIMTDELTAYHLHNNLIIYAACVDGFIESWYSDAWEIDR